MTDTVAHRRDRHGISHSALLEVVTAAAMQKILEAEKGDVILPDETQLEEETTLVYDNIDRLEETLSGKGTSHRVNGIAVQRGFISTSGKKKEPQYQRTNAEVFRWKIRALPHTMLEQSGLYHHT